MKRHANIAQAVPFLLLVCYLLLFDTAGLMRMSLFASVLHEGGHALCIFALHKPVHFTVNAFGLAIKMPQGLSLRQENAILLCGPLVNLLAAAMLFCMVQYRMTYHIYFFAIVQGCVGLFNLLPLQAFDGGRLLQNLLSQKEKYAHEEMLEMLDISCSAVILATGIYVLLRQKNAWITLPVVLYGVLQLFVWKK